MTSPESNEHAEEGEGSGTGVSPLTASGSIAAITGRAGLSGLKGVKTVANTQGILAGTRASSLAAVNLAALVRPSMSASIAQQLNASSLVSASLGAYRAEQINLASLIGPSVLGSIAEQLGTASLISGSLGAYQAQQGNLASLIESSIGARNAQLANATSAIAAIAAAQNAQHVNWATSVMPMLDLFADRAKAASSLYSANMLSVLPSLAMSLSHTSASMTLQARLRTLEQGFDSASLTGADGFGRLKDATRRQPSLSVAVDSAIRATQTRGPFGPNLTSLREGAVAVSELLDATEPDSTLIDALVEVQEVTQLDDEMLLDLGAGLGWWEQIKTHRVSTAGVLLGYTVGLTNFVLTSGTGTAAPVSVFEALVMGGAVYFTISDRGPKRPNG
jgi:hypothetical protein